MKDLQDSWPLTDTFRDPDRVRKLAAQVHAELKRPVTFMEVCGTHTVAVHRLGLRQLLPAQVHLLSGPGCPVCVTPDSYLAKAHQLAQRRETIICTFGDLLRVPGPYGSLEQMRARGADVRLVYSPHQALGLARSEPGRRIVFLAVGFETTAPLTATVLREAKVRNTMNFLVLSGHKLIPPAMRSLAESGDLSLDGFLCPGHVSVVIGSEPYRFLAEEKRKPCVIAGFEPVDILQGLLMLIRQVNAGRSEVEIQYTRAVVPGGNARARSVVNRVFRERADTWRGLGNIPASGLSLTEEYADLDAEPLVEDCGFEDESDSMCICGEVLRGVSSPMSCPLFGGACTPDRPRGPCMVSSEGTCAALFHYGGRT